MRLSSDLLPSAISFATNPTHFSAKKNDFDPKTWFDKERKKDDLSPDGVLPSTRDRFRGCTVDTGSDLIDINASKFSEQLKSARTLTIYIYTLQHFLIFDLIILLFKL